MYHMCLAQRYTFVSICLLFCQGLEEIVRGKVYNAPLHLDVPSAEAEGNGAEPQSKKTKTDGQE